MRGRRAATWLPSRQEVLLLRAGLWEGERGLEAWTEWRRGAAEMETIERGSYRLLPLVYRNLGPLLADDPDAGRLKGVYRRSWAANQLGLRVGRRAIEALHAAQLEVLALKGGALIGSAYRDAGARPMGDLDLAVRPHRVADAVRALREANLRPVEEDAVRALRVRHSLAFRDAAGQEIDLHRNVLWRPGLDREFWLASVEAEVAGARLRTLCPADQLLQVCVHGAAWNPVQPIRWAADAYKVLEASGKRLDWGRLSWMAEHGRLTLPLSEALAHLGEELEAPIPEQVTRALSVAQVSAGERRAHEALARPPSSRRSLAMLWWFWERHRAQAALDGGRPGPSAFLRYMRDFWGLDRPSQVPAFAMRRLLRRRGGAGRPERAS